MRKSIFNIGLFLFAMVLALPSLVSRDAQAAGLGKLTVNSALGQPFKAEIELVAVKKEEVSSLAAKIASRDAFRQANVDYSILLASFKVSVETRADGQPYVKITSSRPVTDPFVSMLVELTWSSGRLLREYTVLLDPIETEAPRVAAPKTQAVPAPLQAPAPQPVAPQPVAEAPAAAPAPAREVAVEPKAAAPAPAAVPAPVREMSVADKSGATGATYGPVKRGDTLAKIAREVAPQGVNLDQMLVALQRANRDAFSANNMNRLKTGPILRVPDSSEIATIAPEEAKKEVKVQAADWNSYRQKLAALAGAAAVVTEAPKQEVSGKITTTVQDKAVADKEAPKDVLKLSKGEEPGAGGKDSKDAKAMKARIQAMEEDATAKSKALKEANERVGILEKNVADMQRLLELKNAAIAEAQKQAQAAAKLATPPAAPAAPTVAPAPAVATPAEPVKSDATPSPAPETPVAEVKPEDAAVVAGASAVEATDSAKPVAETKPAAPAVPAAAVSPPPPVAEPSLLDELMNYIEYVVGALVLLLAGAGGFVFWKKKKSGKSGGMMAPVAAQQIHEAVSVVPSAGTETVAQTDEVDPVAEAEVYLAYGRDTQAEEILKEALAKNPANAECLAKLLEVHVMRKDKQSFEATARALQAVAPEGPLWERAIGLGIGIDPTNPLYGGAVAVDVNEGAAAAPTPDFSLDAGTASDVTPDVDFDLGGTTTTPVADPEATMLAQPEPEPDYGLKFGAKDGTEDVEATMVMSLPGYPAAAAPAEHAAPTPPPVEGLEDALMFDLGTPASAPAEAPAAKAAPDEDMGMAFSIDFPSASEPAPAKSSPEPEADLAAINFNMNDMLSSAPADAGSGAVEKDAHWHEISTKFDLAKAYQEMGDNDGAKEILQEVIREGDAQQQEDAKAMLASL